MPLEGSSALLEEWIGGLRARWAGHRAAAAEARRRPGRCGWTATPPRAVACDAAVTPVVTGDVNPARFDDLVRLCVQLDRLRHGPARGRTGRRPRHRPPRRRARPGPGPAAAGAQPAAQVPAAAGRRRSREALEQAIIGKAADLLSGPGGLASFLRRRQLGARLAGPSLPLDIGYARPSPPRSATRSGSATGTAGGPAAATSPPRPARSTTPRTKPTAAAPA